MNIGNSIKLKQGIFDPHLKKFDLNGWQGRITFFYPLNNLMLIQIAWDSVTLKQMPLEFIKSYIKNKWGYAISYIKIEDVELSKPRDSIKDVYDLVEKMDNDYNNKSYTEQEKRVSKIFPSLDISVNKKNLIIYFEHLQKNLRKPIILAGLSETPFEIFDFIGYKPQSDKILKKDIPLVKDKFEFIELVNDFDEQYGLYAMVERLKDKTKFKLVLFELMCMEKSSGNNELINDYSNWFLTYSEVHTTTANAKRFV